MIFFFFQKVRYILLTTIFLSMFHLAYIIQCAQRTGLYYSSRTAHCPILSLEHSALPYIISWAQRTALYYLLGIPKWVILPLGHTEVGDITSCMSTF